MKVKVDGKILKDAAALVDHAVNPKSDVPDESHVFVMVSDTGGLYLCGQNDKYMVKVSDLAVKDPVKGMFMIHANYWQQLMASCGDKQVEIDSDDSTYANIRLIATSGKVHKFAFNVMAADQYVPISVSGIPISCTVDKFHMRDALRIVRPTADSGNSLDVVNGVCFELDTAQVRLIATDLSTLGYAEVDAVYKTDPTQKTVRVVPREAMDIVDRMLANMASSNIEITAGDTTVSFRSGEVELVTKILAQGNQYINWQRIIPDAPDGPNFNVVVSSITAAMNMAEIVNGGQPVSVDFMLTKDGVKIQAVGLGGTHEGDLAYDTLFGECKFRLDSKLVKNALRCMESQTQLQVAPVNEGKRLQVTPNLPNIGNNAYQLWGTKTRKKGDA